MSNGSRLLGELIDALRCLPGVGAKSAQRMAFHLLERERQGGLRLASALESAMRDVGNCTRCRNFSETPVGSLCASASRRSASSASRYARALSMGVDIEAHPFR